MPFDRFKLEIERALNGPDAEPWDLIYFKLYKSQVPVVEQALEIAARMLGSVGADFLAGANLENGDPELLLFAIRRFVRFLTPGQRQLFLQEFGAAA